MNACYRLGYTNDVRRFVFAFNPDSYGSSAFYLYA